MSKGSHIYRSSFKSSLVLIKVNFDKGHLPKITLNRMYLVRMPVVAVCEEDSLEVSARIGLMEKGLNEVKNSIDNIIKNNNNIAVNLNKVPPIHVVGEEVVVAGVVARQCHGHLVDGGNQQQHKQRPWSAVVPGPQAENNKEMVECQRTTALTNFKYRTGQQARVHYYARFRVTSDHTSVV